MTQPFWSLQNSVEIADLWGQLLDAANAGDERARDFLGTFGPWASDELATWPKS
jgi:hypothetical protein